jgi:hypothetical protein
VNLCFDALDRHVVHGRADQVAVEGPDGERPVTYARLLEDVAAFGGVLRAFGVGPGVQVRSDLAGRDGLVTLLAALRVGADVLVDDSPGVTLPDGVVVRRDATGDDLDRDVLLRAGRTDPAPSLEVADEQVLEGEGWPYDAVATLLAGGTVRMEP